MIGIGFDLCEIARMEKLLQEGDRFLMRYFTPEEQAYIHSRNQLSAQSMAAIFAAKEAFLKAMGTGMNGQIPLTDIEIRHEESGQPKYHLIGAAAQKLQEAKGTRVLLSLTHEAGVAGAMTVIV